MPQQTRTSLSKSLKFFAQYRGFLPQGIVDSYSMFFCINFAQERCSLQKHNKKLKAIEMYTKLNYEVDLIKFKLPSCTAN